MLQSVKIEIFRPAFETNSNANIHTMKNLFSILFLAVAVVGNGQTFEGTFHWTMTMEITDPVMKAKMDEAQKQLNDPETQAQLKEMQAKMNDPEMKKMMEQNPQMKAAMETAMKSAARGGDIKPW